MVNLNLRFFIFLLALISAGSVHLINRSYLLNSMPETLRMGATVETSDDASYLAPVRNFLEGNGWKSNAAGDAAYTTRSPGYGMIYLVFRFLLSEKTALFALFGLQVLLFAFSISRIPQLAALLNIPVRWGMLAACIIAVMPTFSGFLSYTLTEGVTPALVILFLYRFFKAQKGSISELIRAVCILAFLILIRPAMILWVLAPALMLWNNSNFQRKPKAYLIPVFAFIPLFIWQVWAFAKTESTVSLHTIYHSDSNDLYRPVHSDIWNFHKSWGQKGVDFHRGMTGLWRDAREGISPDGTVNDILKNIDPEVTEEIGEENLRNSYLEYYQILTQQVNYFENGLPMPGITSEEAQLSTDFQNYRSEYIRHHFFYSTIVVPLKVYWRLAGHSNLSLYMFQRPLRGKVLMEAFRILSFLVYCGTFLLFPVACFLLFKNRNVLIIALPILLYLGYLCTIQRGIEERYAAPVLIPMFLVVIYAVFRLFRKKTFSENEIVNQSI